MANDGTGSMIIRLFRFLCGGLSQRAWAKLVGVQRRQVQAWENGRTVPRRSTLELLATRSNLVLSEVEPLVPALLRLERMREGRLTAFTSPGLSMEALDVLLGEAVDLELPRLLTELPPLTSNPAAIQEQAKADRAAAEFLVSLLVGSSEEERELLIRKGRSFRNWAVVERLCARSEEAAADEPKTALTLASLACKVAEKVEGPPALRNECQGYAWCFLANARRVGNDLKGSTLAFTKAKDFLRAGTAPGQSPLERTRPLDLEASLRRNLDQPEEALALLAQALAICRTSQAEGRLLLIKGVTLQTSALARIDPPLLGKSDPPGSPRLLS